ncbi:hypothetical protein B0T14DRAFT_96953 [Immersiella caudata]|uniref:Uncharacterized protein n=1 Tax=Immersiella caudata TaxID=314043 RepID=A0AA39X3D7_9PEZI|nr:hypothetical protein B0T14DRAFT_96953 [Immersiella caudata]
MERAVHFFVRIPAMVSPSSPAVSIADALAVLFLHTACRSTLVAIAGAAANRGSLSAGGRTLRADGGPTDDSAESWGVLPKYTERTLDTPSCWRGKEPSELRQISNWSFGQFRVVNAWRMMSCRQGELLTPKSTRENLALGAGLPLPTPPAQASSPPQLAGVRGWCLASGQCKATCRIFSTSVGPLQAKRVVRVNQGRSPSPCSNVCKRALSVHPSLLAGAR